MNEYLKFMGQLTGKRGWLPESGASEGPKVMQIDRQGNEALMAAMSKVRKIKHISKVVKQNIRRIFFFFFCFVVL